MKNASEDRAKNRLVTWAIVLTMATQLLEAAQVAVALARGIG